jgi:hypothetical protein
MRGVGGVGPDDSGIAVTLPLPPRSWAILAACAAATGPGKPRAVSDAVIADRNCDSKIVPRMAKPRLAP